MTDRELVAAVVHDGSEIAFRDLYRRYTPRLHCTALRLMGASAMDAEDVVQETWIRAVREFGSFRWEAALGTWLTSIALNVARDLMRKRSRRSEETLDPAQLEAVTRPAGETVDLERAIALLPEGYRTVLVLHDIEGLTHEEIGHVLGIAPGTSKSQLFSARRSMRALLDPAEVT